jgi:hypothetical protein
MAMSFDTQSPSRRPNSYIALSTPALHLAFGLALFLFPVGVQFKIFLHPFFGDAQTKLFCPNVIKNCTNAKRPNQSKQRVPEY